MNAITKFVINRDDLEYIYTEKITTNYGIRFIVYQNGTIKVYHPDPFYATYGSDPKLNVYHATSNMAKKLLTSSLDTDLKREIYNKLNNILQNFDTKNIKNPNLGSSKRTLLSLYDKYNKIDFTNDEAEIDYSHDWEVLEKHKKDNEAEEAKSPNASEEYKELEEKLNLVRTRDII